MKLKCVSSKEIEDITKLLKRKNLHGYDGITTKILKASILYISSPLTYIGNKMLTSGIFPMRLKFSEIKSVFKKEIEMIHRITDVSLCLHHFRKSFKKLSIIDYISILIIKKAVPLQA